jgi:hypothetical protein
MLPWRAAYGATAGVAAEDGAVAVAARVLSSASVTRPASAASSSGISTPGAASNTARTHSESVMSAARAVASSTANSSSLTFVPMDLVRSGAFIVHRRFDCVEDLGRTPSPCRNVQDTEPCRAVFSLKGGETSGYPFSNRRLLPE